MESKNEEEEKITEDQRARAEGNRAAALAKRKAILSTTEEITNSWRLFKCHKPTTNFPIPNQTSIVNQVGKPSGKFKARLQICSPDSFSVTPVPVEGCAFPGEELCFEQIRDCLYNILPSHYTQNTGGGKACVYKLGDYQLVRRSFKNSKGIECEEIPWGTFNVIERLSHSFIAGKWIPCRPEHLPDEKVDELIADLPKTLLNALLPFQLNGVRFGVRRGGRCLIADEMGLGKTLQAIAIAGCFMKEGSILVVCPAILRYSWAEELERWFPYCLPTDIHLVFGHQDDPARLPKHPRIVVTSYTMLRRLQRSMLKHEWATLIVDESHHLHCTKRSSEKDELKAVLDVAVKVKHLILLSGTPSLSRPYDIFHQVNMLWPGLLGQTKYEFAKTYCCVNFVQVCEGKVVQDFSKGIRLEELNILLNQSIMIRRLKEHVLPQLPPKRRQIINLVLRRSDINLAMETIGLESSDTSTDGDDENVPLDEYLDIHMKQMLSKRLSALGIAKLPGFFEWFSIHPIMTEMHGEDSQEESSGSRKMIIFSYHHKVLDGVQAFLCQAGIQFVRIDCNVTGCDRQSAVHAFQFSKEVRIALIGIRSGGFGLNLTAADNVVFLEIPLRPADLQQAEDRAHRHGQRKLVNIYIFCAKDTLDELHWRRLNWSLLHVSSTVNGKCDVIQEIEVESVSYLETSRKPSEKNKKLTPESTIFNDESASNSVKFQESCYKLDLHPVGSSSDSDLKVCGGGEHDDPNNIVSYSRRQPTHKIDTILPQISLNGDGKLHEVQSGVDSSVQGTLRFEVSRYTGRIHLYSCILGTDLRPRPLFENFRQEEVECHQVEGDNEKMADKQLYRNALVAFITEWKQLRPIDKKKLTGKPLQLPLSCELCYLNENLNHDNGGLLRGGSNRRKTPWDEISYPLPSNAVWRKVSLYSSNGQKEKLYTQGCSDMDEPLCKLCQTPCKKKNVKVPQFFEDLFCTLECFEEYRSRTSNRYLRQELFKIERGVCTNCRLDCHRLVEHLRPLPLEIRHAYVKKEAPIIAKLKKLLDKLVHDPTEGNAWHADHIIPVYKGGGECKLENMRTLCVACHATFTAAQCAERRFARKETKKRLKDIMSGLVNVKKPRSTGVLEDCEEDHNLLMEIPGSAYSKANCGQTNGCNEERELSDYPCLNYIGSDRSDALKLSPNKKGSQKLENPCDPEIRSMQIVYTESGEELKVTEYGKREFE